MFLPAVCTFLKNEYASAAGLVLVLVMVRDRHEHLFCVTDSLGQTLQHNVYHLVCACGMQPA
jgi:hypothetical protein